MSYDTNGYLVVGPEHLNGNADDGMAFVKARLHTLARLQRIDKNLLQKKIVIRILWMV